MAYGNGDIPCRANFVSYHYHSYSSSSAMLTWHFALRKYRASARVFAPGQRLSSWDLGCPRPTVAPGVDFVQASLSWLSACCTRPEARIAGVLTAFEVKMVVAKVRIRVGTGDRTLGIRFRLFVTCRCDRSYHKPAPSFHVLSELHTHVHARRLAIKDKNLLRGRT